VVSRNRRAWLITDKCVGCCLCERWALHACQSRGIGQQQHRARARETRGMEASLSSLSLDNATCDHSVRRLLCVVHTSRRCKQTRHRPPREHFASLTNRRARSDCRTARWAYTGDRGVGQDDYCEQLGLHDQKHHQQHQREIGPIASMAPAGSWFSDNSQGEQHLLRLFLCTLYSWRYHR